MKKITRYIDIDGVVIDTEAGLFDEYNRRKSMGENIKRLVYLQNLNWQEWIRQANIINDSINIIKEHDPSSMTFLTRIHSLNEGTAKIEYFREQGIKNSIILVPHTLSKSSVVEAKQSLLVDDSIKNLDDWSTHDGIPLFFNAEGTNQSTFKEQTIINENYPVISSLESVFSEETEEYCKRLTLKRK